MMPKPPVMAPGEARQDLPATGRRPPRRLAGGLVLLGLIVGLLTVRQAVEAGWPLPGCAFREFTGHPCAFCGTTRSLAALAGGNLWTAIRWNPLAMVGVLVATGWALARFLGFPPLPNSWFRRAWKLALLLLFLNWVWLLRTGP